MRGCLNPVMSRHVPLATPPITADITKLENGIGLHLWDCHSVWSVSVEFFVLSNNIYLSWAAQREEAGGSLQDWRCVVLVKHGWNLKSFFSLFNPFKLSRLWSWRSVVIIGPYLPNREQRWEDGALFSRTLSNGSVHTSVCTWFTYMYVFWLAADFQPFAGEAH